MIMLSNVAETGRITMRTDDHEEEKVIGKKYSKSTGY
jgi:hypothetical protein